MKVEELMIGDWIVGPDLSPKKVVAILNFDEIQVEDEPDSDTWITYSIGDVEPIPLLGWMLTYSGFRKYGENERQFWPFENWLYINYRCNTKVAMWQSMDRWFFKHESADGYTGIRTPLPTGSVHELQHVLRLCGIDLDVNVLKLQ